mmetsp:Transcript_50136/g.119341  ORF Transcript_50136/g.119341 Transcript_50136/m.119341 type:complete len:426 (-) Transcript_50136:73-1350(-)
MGQQCVCPPKTESRSISTAEYAEHVGTREPVIEEPLKSVATADPDSNGGKGPSAPDTGPESPAGASRKEVDLPSQKASASSLPVADAEADKTPDAQLSNLTEIMGHLQNLRADRAWEVAKRLQAEQPGKDVLEALEQRSECTEPLQWLAPWGFALDQLSDAIVEPKYPPADTPRPNEPAGSGKWSVFHLNEKEDEGMRGEIYARYLPKAHGVEMRANMVMPGRFCEHFEGVLEVDLAPQVCPTCFADAKQWNASIPGNFLFHLIVKLPKLPKMWWRDILIHRQVFNTQTGVLVVEYSPKGKQGDGSTSKAYYNGGAWSKGLPGVVLPKCHVSGRDSQIGGYSYEPCKLEDGSQGVRFRSCQIVDATTPRWLPVPQSWYPWAAAFICRRTLGEFARARRANHDVYERRAQERPAVYKPEWHLRSAE